MSADPYPVVRNGRGTTHAVRSVAAYLVLRETFCGLHLRHAPGRVELPRTPVACKRCRAMLLARCPENRRAHATLFPAADTEGRPPAPRGGQP